jgi:hypothetical protein
MRTDAQPKRSPLTFFVLVYIVAIPFWLLGAVVEPPEDFPIKLPVSALQLLAPLIAAAILVYREEGLGGIGRLLRSTVSFRGLRPMWLVVIVMLSPTIYLLSYGVMLLLGRQLPEPTLPVPDMPILFAIFFLSAIAEEAGWTSYATDPLQERWSALRAALVVGLAWGLLHVVPDLQGGRDLGWIAWHHVVGAVSLRILFVSTFNNTGAVMAAALLHTMDNVCWQLFLANAPYDPAITAPIYAMTAILVIVLWGARTLAAGAAVGHPLPTGPGAAA